MNKKVPLIIIGILLVIIIVVLVVFGKKEDDDGSNLEVNYKYMVIDDVSVWGYDNDKWSILSKNSVNNKDLDVYVDYRYVGYYKLKFVNDWNLFDLNGNYVNYDGKLLAVSSNLNIDVSNINVVSIDDVDLNKVNNLLSMNLSVDDLSVNEKVIVDLDHDGVNDKIVNVSNIRNEISGAKFNLCFVELNGNTKILVKESYDYEYDLEAPMYDINLVLNLKNGTYKNIILQKSYFSNVGRPGNVMYSYVNGEYKEVIKDVK